jgi:putative Mg2+ transporter-C (MgtC) family protein
MLEKLDIISLILLILIGILIGWEREKANKCIGKRTVLLILIGSYIYTFVSTQIGIDHSRIIAQIVSGVGFIGGGMIIKSKNEDTVKNLTTAVTVWSLAAEGILLGLNYFIPAILFGILIYIILISNE